VDSDEKDEAEETEEKPPVFYYNREGRIARAPKIVRDYYAGKNRPVTGLFKVLVATPAKRALFFSIVALCVIVVFLNYSLGSDSSGRVGGIPVSLSAFAFEDTVYISVRFDKTPYPSDGREAADGRVVTADITIFNADNQVFETRNFRQNYAGSETFIRTTIPDYDILRIEAVVALGGAGSDAARKTSLKTSVTRK
jgi:hypothetical protein